MMLVLFRAEVAAGEQDDQRVPALQLAELALRVRVIGQLVVGKGPAGNDVGAHWSVLQGRVGPWSHEPGLRARVSPPTRIPMPAAQFADRLRARGSPGGPGTA